jgi:capsular exopolysaccharide synthesis family protein
MSRIFSALQRSESDGVSFDFPLVGSLTEELRSVPEAIPAVESENSHVSEDQTEQFQSVAISPTPDSRLVSLTDQASLGAEKFRFLGVRLRQLQQTSSLKKLLITSTIPEEGKSFVSANLAITLAQRRPQRVLLVEGDLRRPSLNTRFGIPKLPGLGEWLQGDLRSMGSIYYLEQVGFWILPAGSPPENHGELMQSERLSELVGQLSGRFDWILIDSPPVVPLADTSAWIRSVDGVLLVVREGITQKRQLVRGLRVLERSKVLGVVMNSATNSIHDEYYGRYGYAPVKSNGSVKGNRRPVL